MKRVETQAGRHFAGIAAALLTVTGCISFAEAQTQKQRQPAQEVTGNASPGRYAMLREEGRDSGCLVNLLPGGRAQLGPGCKDQGLVVFDPTGWSAGRNSIVLRARKGHRVNFIHKPDGTWLRDPPDKVPLSLRKH